MRVAKRVAENTTIVLIGRILNSLLGFATVFLLVGHFDPADFGRYNYVFFYIGMFSVITELGMSPVLVRQMARDRSSAGEILATGMIVKVFTATISFAVALLVLPVLNDDEFVFRLVFILGLQLFAYPILTCENIFKIELKMSYPVLCDLVRNMIYFGGVVYVVWTPRLGLVHLIGLATATTFLFAGVKYGLSRKFVRIRFRYQHRLARQLLAASIPLGLSQLAITFYYRLDTVMLDTMKGPEAVGYYALAVKISEVFSYLPSAFMVSVYPFLSEFWQNSREKFMEVCELALRVLLAAALPIAILGSLFAPQLVSIFPDDYSSSAGSLVFLIWAEVFIFLNIALYNIFNAMNRERWNLYATLLMLAGNVGLNLLLIPKYSHQGASFATLSTEVFGFLFLGVLLTTLLKGRLQVARLTRTVLAGIVLGGILHLLVGKASVSLTAALVWMTAFTLVYAGALYALRVIDFQELRRLLKADR